MSDNLSSLLTIGNANKEDAETASMLMYLAFGDFSHHLFGTTKEDRILKYLKKLWQMQHNRMSSRYSNIMRENGKPVGLISCYGGELIKKMFLPSFWEIVRIDPGLIPYILFHPHYLYGLLTSPEAMEDEFYIFMLAVLPEYQNQGRGTQLLKFAEEKARALGFKKLSLVVRKTNEGAIRFYERNGFNKVLLYDRKPMHIYKMVKELN